uniref:Uncharacterized protein n=1 Tax=Micrurus corallinus TaxID=54390 RepID=A0A2D4G0M9_MICCO
MLALKAEELLQACDHSWSGRAEPPGVKRKWLDTQTREAKRQETILLPYKKSPESKPEKNATSGNHHMGKRGSNFSLISWPSPVASPSCRIRKTAYLSALSTG